MKKVIFIILSATLLLASCSDFLVEEPKLSQSTELTLSTFDGLDKSVAGAYSPLADGEWYGAFMVLDAEMRAGNAMIPFNPNFTSGRMTVPYQLNYNESSTSGLWGYGYYVISAVNNVMAAIDAEPEKYAVQGVTLQDLANIYAECLTLRALAHFDMLRTYARTDGSNDELGIPIILKTDKTGTEQPKRNTVTEVYAQIIADLLAAEASMAATYVRSATDSRAVITVPVIQALLARVYLYAKMYQQAADYATKVISSGNYKLWTAAEYPTVWGKDVQAAGGEVIFEVYGIRSNSYDEYWEGPSHMTNPLGYGDCAASYDLGTIFEAGDVRGTSGVRGTDEGKVMFCTDKDSKSNSFWTMKYQGKGKGDAVSTPDVNNVIVLRLSEMYLIRAEAIMNGASVSGASALADVNAIRAKRNVDPLTSVGAETLALERRRELNFEGHRWFDLARTTATLTYVDGVQDKNLDPTSKYWALPLSKRELEVNTSLVQNTGY